MPSPPPHSFTEGSVWPAWGEDAWIELAFLRLAARDGFSVVHGPEYKGSRAFYKYCAYECHEDPLGGEYCDCRVVSAIEARTGKHRTAAVSLGHNHPPCEDSDERERLRQKAREGIQRIEVELCNAAMAELEKLFKRAGYRRGFEQEEDNEVRPHEEQQSVIRDLGIALGDALARKVERKASEAELLVEGYSQKERILDRSRPSQLCLPASDAAGPSQAKPQPASTPERPLTAPRRYGQYNNVPNFPSTSSKRGVEKAGKSSMEGPEACHHGSEPLIAECRGFHPSSNQSETFAREGSSEDRVERSPSLHGPDPPRLSDSTAARQTLCHSRRSSCSPSATTSSSTDPRRETTMTQPITVPAVAPPHVPPASPSLVEYLRGLDCTGAFDFSSLEPYFVKNGVRTPQQLETYARGHWSSLMRKLEQEGGLGAMEREMLGSCLEDRLGLGVKEEAKDTVGTLGGAAA
ncbi:hypothetical protein JCM21900_001508 [Sporobolomyces salmonicolor]